MAGTGEPDQAQSGWYEDPLCRYQHRYWDGVSWTSHVANGADVAVDPPTRSSDDAARSSGPSRTLESSRPPRKAKRWKKVIGILLTTLVIYLVFSGAFLVTGLPVLVDRLGSRIESKAKISVFIRDDAAASDVTALEKTILSESERVDHVENVSKEEAIRRFREQMKDSPEVLEGLDGNPLPASLEVSVKDPADIQDVVARIKADEHLGRVVTDPDKDISYGQRTLDRLFSLARALRVFGFLLLGLAGVLWLVAIVWIVLLPAPGRAALAAWGVLIGFLLFGITALGGYIQYMRVFPSFLK